MNTYRVTINLYCSAFPYIKGMDYNIIIGLEEENFTFEQFEQTVLCHLYSGLFENCHSHDIIKFTRLYIKDGEFFVNFNTKDRNYLYHGNTIKIEKLS